MTEPLRIVTFFWSDPNAKHHGTYEFVPKHINRLQEAFKKHLKIPHEFVCVTDNPDSINVTDIRVIPLWNEFRDLGRCFVRLGVYSKSMADIIGPRFVCIDLDTVILDDVTSIFDRPEPFVGYRDSKNPKCLSGALYMMNAGAKEEVYNSFRRLYQMVPEQGRREWFLKTYNRTSDLVGSDQSWQSEVIGTKNVPRWTWDDGIYDYWNVEELPELPENAKIVFMNGLRRDASLPEFQKKHPWIDKWWNS